MSDEPVDGQTVEEQMTALDRELAELREAEVALRRQLDTQKLQ